MTVLFPYDNPADATIEKLSRQLAETSERCRQLEELLGIGAGETLPGRNEVIARAERDAALIRVTAQRFADQLLYRATRRARELQTEAEPWAGRQRVAHLWDIDADELDANINSFMASTNYP